MAIVESAISAEIQALTQQLNGGVSSNPDSEKAFADGLASIIKNAIVSATVTIPIGLVSQGASPTVIVNPAPIPMQNSIT